MVAANFGLRGEIVFQSPRIIFVGKKDPKICHRVMTRQNVPDYVVDITAVDFFSMNLFF
jgi:hypothetical protein